MRRIERALISVSDKTGIVEFARGLQQMDIELISTGGTASTLKEAGLTVRSVSDLTHFPEMLDGRVKTLHPAIHGGILANRQIPAHMETLKQHSIQPIDLVCVNLYPFVQTINRRDAAPAEIIENIDIGGPAMIRSAAKNHDGVAVVVSPQDYEAILEEMKRLGGGLSEETRRRLAGAAYAHTAVYDTAIARWFAKDYAPSAERWPEKLIITLEKVQDCRYGENPHQSAAFYRDTTVKEPCIANARQIHGKELSFNNIYDINAALETVKEWAKDEPAAVIIKHTNPCGVAVAATLIEAFQRAREGDPISAFGGILAVNRVVDAATAEAITGKNTFFEAIIAPGYDPAALPILTEKKKWGANLRLMEVASLSDWDGKREPLDLKRVTGGLLAQDPDQHDLTADDLKVVTQRPPTADEIAEMLFAWRVVKHVKSNAIVFSRSRQVVGIGAGQMNRVQSVRLAVEQAGEKAHGAVMASDAFFPFPDGPEAAAEAGITAIIQPGGSVKDAETIEVADRHGIAMVFTGIRHFLH